METKHIVDIIYQHLKNSRKNAPSAKKIFISDWELKKYYYDKERNEVIIPSNAILSPLSLDWIEYQNVKVKKIAGN